jgi:hypothetical protein
MLFRQYLIFPETLITLPESVNIVTEIYCAGNQELLKKISRKITREYSCQIIPADSFYKAAG